MDGEVFIANTQLRAVADMGTFISDVQVQLFEDAFSCRTASFLFLYRQMKAAGIDMKGMKDECGNSLLLMAVKAKNAVEADRYPIVRYVRRVNDCSFPLAAASIFCFWDGWMTTPHPKPTPPPCP